MTFGIVHHFAGGTKEQYEATPAAGHPSDGSLPDGQIFHTAGPSDGGWTIMAVHDTQSSWEQLRDTILSPKIEAGIEGGFTGPPTAMEIDTPAMMATTRTTRRARRRAIRPGRRRWQCRGRRSRRRRGRRGGRRNGWGDPWRPSPS